LFENGLSEMPELKRELEGAGLCSRERGAVTSMRSLQRVYRHNVALLGDASGSVDAITGEGLRIAFRQAFALADAMQAGDLSQYQRAHRQLARRPMMMGNLLLWLGRNPRIRSRAIRAMQHRPELFARMLAAHAGEATPTELLSAGASLGWNFLAV
jgi:flavin-dependent dehydrogenase